MSKQSKPVAWLPVDSRLFGNVFSFGHVKGTAKIFLTLEIILAVITVLAAIVMIFVRAGL